MPSLRSCLPLSRVDGFIRVFRSGAALAMLWVQFRQEIVGLNILARKDFKWNDNRLSALIFSGLTGLDHGGNCFTHQFLGG